MEKITLENICDGALKERFDRELGAVIRNIMDLNTADGKRDINIKVSITPTDDRMTYNAEVSVSSKLQPLRPISSGGVFERQGGQIVAAKAPEVTPIHELLNNMNEEKDGTND
jgi:hypothetical protein